MAKRDLQQLETFILDLDGTVYLGDRLLPGAGDFLRLVRESQRRLLFLTNNSSNSKQRYAEKLRRLGLAVSDDEVFTSGEATAIYLREHFAGASILLIGTPALEQEFLQHGLKLTAPQAEVAVLGFDTTLTYAKLRQLCDLVRAGVPYLATHPDLNCPIEGGLIPDIGAMIAFVAASTGRQPDQIIGKPYPPIVEALVRRTGLEPAALGMVGDRLSTDIALGAAGLFTVLVLSGATRLEELATAPQPPDLVVDDLAHLARLLAS